MDENQFEKVFPWPADRPLRRARFGKPPTRGKLRKEDFNGDQPDPKPWALDWHDDELGLHVEVRLDRGSRDVWAYASSPRAAYVDKAVSVGLVGKREEQIRRVTVPLGDEGPEGCKGSALFAALEELYELGEDVDLIVFLLE